MQKEEKMSSTSLYEQAFSKYNIGDIKGCIEILLTEAARSEPDCVGMLATMCEYGEGLPQNLHHARNLYIEAANLGDTSSIFMLGRMLYTEDEFRSEKEFAKQCIKKAALMNLSKAQVFLAGIYMDEGAGFFRAPPKKIQAIAWLLVAAHKDEDAIEYIESFSGNIPQEAKALAEEIHGKLDLIRLQAVLDNQSGLESLDALVLDGNI